MKRWVRAAVLVMRLLQRTLSAALAAPRASRAALRTLASARVWMVADAAATSIALALSLAWSLQCAEASAATPADSGREWRAAIETMVAEHPMLAGQDLRIDYPATLPRWPVCKAPRAQSTRQGIPVGRLSISLRCNEPRWQGAIQVVVVARRTHYAAARALQAGAVVDADAIVSVESDWASLPDDVVTEPEQVLGRVLVRSVAAGTALTLNLVRQTAVIRNGERVRVQMSGANFVVAGEGVALQAGSAGDQVRVKMGGGQIVTAIVVRQGLVELRID